MGAGLDVATAVFIKATFCLITDPTTDGYLTLQKEKPQILKVAPIKDIAPYLGITDTSLSRIRKEVEKCKLFFSYDISFPVLWQVEFIKLLITFTQKKNV